MDLMLQVRQWRNFFAASRALGHIEWADAPMGGKSWKKYYLNSFVFKLHQFPVPREARCIVDAGANIGLFSKAATLYCPNATVFAIEPCSRALESLSENIEGNSRVQKIHAALGASEGTVALKIAKHLASSTVTIPTNECEGLYGAGIGLTGETEQVRVTTLSRLARDLDMKNIDLLKIDVEGYEPEVLQGADEILSTRVFRILLELSIARLSFKKVFDLMQSIIDRGYALVNIVDVTRSDFKAGSPVTQFDAWFLRQ